MARLVRLWDWRSRRYGLPYSEYAVPSRETRLSQLCGIGRSLGFEPGYLSEDIQDTFPFPGPRRPAPNRILLVRWQSGGSLGQAVASVGRPDQGDPGHA